MIPAYEFDFRPLVTVLLVYVGVCVVAFGLLVTAVTVGDALRRRRGHGLTWRERRVSQVLTRTGRREWRALRRLDRDLRE